jgi:plasmid stabilization system protein ParE
MKVVFSAEAATDLEKIADFIAENNPNRAVTFLAELEEACLSLADFAERYAIVPRFASQAIRRRPVGNYLIFYKIGAKRIEILHVLHGAMDVDAALFPNG